jgi:hypothetical protein
MKYLFIFCSLSFCFISCKSGLNATKENIAGHWNIVQAERDGTPTKTLESGFFDFTKEGMVSSNLLPSSEPMPYILESNILKIDGDMPFSFTILEMANDTINMEGLMGNYKVELTLAK